MVIKIPNTPSKEDKLFNDYKIHTLVYRAFETVRSTRLAVHVHYCIRWVDAKSEESRAEKSTLFSKDIPTPNFCLLSECIFPLHLPVREAIVDALCPPAIKGNKSEFLKKPEDKGCLVRIYLGRRNDSRTMEPRNIRLRNFPLHVDEMERLGLDPKDYANAIAQALAFLHWKAGADANDVEFVLGCCPQVSCIPTVQEVRVSTKDTAAQLQRIDLDQRFSSI